MAAKIRNYIALARPHHWFKNIFILPGTIFALYLLRLPFSKLVAYRLGIGLLSACLLVSANYTLNEWLDAASDKFHPVKKLRPSVLGAVSFKGVFIQYGFLAAIGLYLAYLVSFDFFAAALALLVMGTLYNVRPFRTKEKPYLDVLSESINNPIRFLLGWFIISSASLPPASLLTAYWMGGAFLMAVKRYAELRMIQDRATAGLYRNSFKYYTENNLLISILFYAMMFAFFFGVFLIKHKIELLIALPFFALMFAWYLHIGMKENSPAQRPERLYEEKWFALYVALLALGVLGLLYITLPALHWFLNNNFINYQ